MVGGLLERDDLGDPFPGDQILGDEDRHPGPGEVRRVLCRPCDYADTVGVVAGQGGLWG